MLRKSQKHPRYFREWRKHRQLTLEAAAERMGTTHATLSRIERGKTKYTEGTLLLMADAYGCEPADLLRPPIAPHDEFSAFVKNLDAKKRQQALRILKAALGDEAA
jgi:transcriptional regulator with XRE-family HTH domain